MAIIINGKTYRNLEEQVEYNKDKIEELGDVEVEVAAIKAKTDLIDVDDDTMTINDGLDIKDNGDVTVGHDLSVENVVNIGNVVLSDNGETLEIDGAEIATEDDIDEVMAVAEGKSKAYVINTTTNPLFNSENKTIQIPISTPIVDIDGNTVDPTKLKKGDVIFLTETDKPDRWFSGTSTPNLRFQILETEKIDLSNYATQTDLQQGLATKITSGAISASTSAVSGASEAKSINIEGINYNLPSGGGGGSTLYHHRLQLGNYFKFSIICDVADAFTTETLADYLQDGAYTTVSPLGVFGAEIVDDNNYQDLMFPYGLAYAFSRNTVSLIRTVISFTIVGANIRAFPTYTQREYTVYSDTVTEL